MSVHKQFQKYQDNQRDFFDKLITEDWSTYADPFWDFTRQWEVSKILKLKKNPKRILDVGCGCGYHDALFANYPFVNYVLGIDYSKKSIQAANKAYPHDKVKRKHIDFLKNKSLSDFDLSVSFQVIEHLKNYEEFLCKMASTVEKNGHVVIATPNFNRLTNKVLKLFKKKPVVCDIMHYKEFTLQELQKLGYKAGLEFQTFFGYSMSFNVKFNIDRYLPKKLLFYLGTFFPRLANVLVVVYKKS